MRIMPACKNLYMTYGAIPTVMRSSKSNKRAYAGRSGGAWRRVLASSTQIVCGQAGASVESCTWLCGGAGVGVGVSILLVGNVGVGRGLFSVNKLVRM